jgi:branched-chain amino acid transport system permease protein
VETALNAFFEILSFGAIIVLVVLGLGVIASMMGIFNFAHGEFVLLGAYTTYLVSRSGLPVWIGMLVAPFVVAAIGLIVERLVIRRFYAAPIVAMLGTYALGLAIRETVRGLIGGLMRRLPTNQCCARDSPKYFCNSICQNRTSRSMPENLRWPTSA